jgi:hypothetical protein
LKGFRWIQTQSSLRFQTEVRRVSARNWAVLYFDRAYGLLRPAATFRTLKNCGA